MVTYRTLKSFSIFSRYRFIYICYWVCSNGICVVVAHRKARLLGKVNRTVLYTCCRHTHFYPSMDVDDECCACSVMYFNLKSPKTNYKFFLFTLFPCSFFVFSGAKKKKGKKMLKAATTATKTLTYSIMSFVHLWYFCWLPFQKIRNWIVD